MSQEFPHSFPKVYCHSSIDFCSKLSDNIIRKIDVTVEIYIQGGINAANGFQSNFKVYPVQTITNLPRMAADGNGTGSGREPQKQAASSFGKFLEQATKNNCPAECYTVTYTADCKLQTYFYQPSREYSL